MNKLLIILGLVHFIIAISILFGYSPSIFELFCAYMVCALTFVAKGIEGAAQ